jgi:hypothetical protein
MQSMKRAAAALCLGALAALPVSAADEPPSVGAVEAIRIATEAYIYGYPLVTFDMARRQQTNVGTRQRAAPLRAPSVSLQRSSCR